MSIINKDLAVVGGGYWGKNLIRDFYQLGVLGFICEKDTRLHFNYQTLYPDVIMVEHWRAVLENPIIKKVVIALPAEMHFQFAKEALLHDKDVYVEKPLALQVRDAEELIKLANEKNKILMVGHLLQYHPAIEKTYEMVIAGKIGKIRYINSNRLNLGKFRQEENVLWSFAPHDISVVLGLMGNQLPKSIICQGHSYITHKIHDVTNTLMEFEDGTYCQINVNWLNPFKEQKMTIVGTKGMIVFDDCSSDKIKYYSEYIDWQECRPLPVKSDGVVIQLADVSSYETPSESSKLNLIQTSNLIQTPLLKECQHFLDSCSRRSTPKTDGEEGLRVLRVLDACQKSLESHGEKIILSKSTESKQVKSIQSKSTASMISNSNIILEPAYFAHSSSIIDSGAKIGHGSKIWHFSHLMNCQVGENCNIGQNVFIGNGVKIGNGCKVQNNVSLYDGVEAGNYVFFGPSCVFTNDLTPRAKYPKGGHYVKTIIEDEVSIGANATIICGITLGKGCMIGAGAVVTKDVAPGIIVLGNPAKFYKNIDAVGEIF